MEESGGDTRQFELAFFSDMGFSNELSAEENASLFLDLDLLSLTLIDGLLDEAHRKALLSADEHRKARQDPDLDVEPDLWGEN